MRLSNRSESENCPETSMQFKRSSLLLHESECHLLAAAVVGGSLRPVTWRLRMGKAPAMRQTRRVRQRRRHRTRTRSHIGPTLWRGRRLGVALRSVSDSLPTRRPARRSTRLRNTQTTRSTRLMWTQICAPDLRMLRPKRIDLYVQYVFFICTFVRLSLILSILLAICIEKSKLNLILRFISSAVQCTV